VKKQNAIFMTVYLTYQYQTFLTAAVPTNQFAVFVESWRVNPEVTGISGFAETSKRMNFSLGLNVMEQSEAAGSKKAMFEAYGTKISVWRNQCSTSTNSEVNRDKHDFKHTFLNLNAYWRLRLKIFCFLKFLLLQLQCIQLSLLASW